MDKDTLHQRERWVESVEHLAHQMSELYIQWVKQFGQEHFNELGLYPPDPEWIKLRLNNVLIDDCMEEVLLRYEEVLTV